MVNLEKALMELGMGEKEAYSVLAAYNESILLNMASDADEFKDMLIEGFEKAAEHGPLVSDRITILKVKLLDAELNGDLTQATRLMKNAISGAIIFQAHDYLNPFKKVPS